MYKILLIQILTLTLNISCKKEKKSVKTDTLSPEKIDCITLSQRYLHCTKPRLDADPQHKKQQILEFTHLCSTKKDWQTRMQIIRGCLRNSNQNCPQLRSCIASEIYKKNYQEAKIITLNPRVKLPWLGNNDDPQLTVIIFADFTSSATRVFYQHLKKLSEQFKQIKILIIPWISLGPEINRKSLLVFWNNGNKAFHDFVQGVFAEKIRKNILEKQPGLPTAKNSDIKRLNKVSNLIRKLDFFPELPLFSVSGHILEGPAKYPQYKHWINFSLNKNKDKSK
ncbi:MAG: hypothetical protein PF689_12570 [Deltaproteobacteria bacterium]|jgi:hypothetical protein|nr:hypothetical protein [Deltaproteobacteria bacterium]